MPGIPCRKFTAQRGLLRISLGGERLDEIDETTANLWVGNLHKCAVQLQTFRRRQEIHHVVGAGCFRHAGRAANLIAGRVFEEEGNGYVQNPRYVLQAAGADTVRALFVLLDLLKGNSETFTQLFLAHAKHGSAKANSASDMNVDGVRLFLILGHHAVLTLGKG
ncbi:hypothetical protein AGR5A_Cc90298 [Agrobacterium genomosp. 5 str. CFBP 6626]|nr:hypothetical protein AGR5A_Cc90298 [Agrobacterium genomosp. 5 str. CFBP 6626]